jgi:cytochrome c556
VPTVPKLFPPGTEGPSPDGKYGAKLQIWSQPEKFQAAVKQVEDQVAALSTAIKTGDKTKAGVALKELDVCSACHNTFRAKLQ